MFAHSQHSLIIALLYESVSCKTSEIRDAMNVYENTAVASKQKTIETINSKLTDPLF